MDDRLHVGARAINLAVDEAFQEDSAATRIQRFAIESERQDITRLNKTRGHATREPEPIWSALVADAHVSKPVEHAFAEKNTIRGHEIGDESGFHHG
jgi:hypothetical protein